MQQLNISSSGCVASGQVRTHPCPGGGGGGGGGWGGTRPCRGCEDTPTQGVAMQYWMTPPSSWVSDTLALFGKLFATWGTYISSCIFAPNFDIVSGWEGGGGNFTYLYVLSVQWEIIARSCDHACTYMCNACVRTHTCTYAHMYIHAHTHMHTHTCTYTHRYVGSTVFTCTHVVHVSLSLPSPPPLLPLLSSLLPLLSSFLPLLLLSSFLSLLTPQACPNNLVRLYSAPSANSATLVVCGSAGPQCSLVDVSERVENLL